MVAGAGIDAEKEDIETGICVSGKGVIDVDGDADDITVVSPRPVICASNPRLISPKIS